VEFLHQKFEFSHQKFEFFERCPEFFERCPEFFERCPEFFGQHASNLPKKVEYSRQKSTKIENSRKKFPEKKNLSKGNSRLQRKKIRRYEAGNLARPPRLPAPLCFSPPTLFKKKNPYFSATYKKQIASLGYIYIRSGIVHYWLFVVKFVLRPFLEG